MPNTKTIIINSSNRQTEAIRWKYPVRYSNITFPPGIYTPINFPQTLATVLNNTVPSTMPFDVQYNPVTSRLTISNTITDFQFLFGETSMANIAILCGFTPAQNPTVYSQYIKGNISAGSATITTNDTLQFRLVSSFIARIPVGFYTYNELANKVEIAMNTSTTGQSYTCTYNEINNQFIINAPVSPGISIYWDTPDTSNLALLMGFRIINPPQKASLYNFIQINTSNSHISPQLINQLSHFRYNFYSVVKATKISIHNLSLLTTDLDKMYNVNNDTNTIIITNTLPILSTFKLSIPNGTYTPMEYCVIATQIANNSITFTYDNNKHKINVSSSISYVGLSFPNKKTADMLGFNFNDIIPTTNTIVSNMCVNFNYPRFIHCSIKYGANNDIGINTTISIDEQPRTHEFVLNTPFEATTIFIELTDEDNNYIQICGNWISLFEFYLDN